jgi:hypothetical protein
MILAASAAKPSYRTWYRRTDVLKHYGVFGSNLQPRAGDRHSPESDLPARRPVSLSERA